MNNSYPLWPKLKKIQKGDKKHSNFAGKMGNHCKSLWARHAQMHDRLRELGFSTIPGAPKRDWDSHSQGHGPGQCLLDMVVYCHGHGLNKILVMVQANSKRGCVNNKKRGFKKLSFTFYCPTPDAGLCLRRAFFSSLNCQSFIHFYPLPPSPFEPVYNKQERVCMAAFPSGVARGGQTFEPQQKARPRL